MERSVSLAFAKSLSQPAFSIYIAYSLAYFVYCSVNQLPSFISTLRLPDSRSAFHDHLKGQHTYPGTHLHQVVKNLISRDVCVCVRETLFSIEKSHQNQKPLCMPPGGH